MVLDRLQQLTHQVTATAPPPHPLDPLSTSEIDAAVSLIRREHGKLNFNAVTLYEPRKAEMMAWVASPETTKRPARMADVVAIAPGGKLYDGVVDLDQNKIISWSHTPDAQPLITMEDLQEVEHVVRKDPKVIEQCGIIGIPPQDMDKVYCDRESTRLKDSDNQGIGC
jgi:primary-amine oxidase